MSDRNWTSSRQVTELIRDGFKQRREQREASIVGRITRRKLWDSKTQSYSDLPGEQSGAAEAELMAEWQTAKAGLDAARARLEETEARYAAVRPQ